MNNSIFAYPLLVTSRAFDVRTGLIQATGPARYFLCRLLLDFAGEPPPTKVIDLARYFFMTDRAVTHAIESLSRLGFLGEAERKTKSVGRPVTAIRVSRELKRALSTIELPEGADMFGELIQHVLTSPFKPAEGRPRKTALSPYNRFLLAALFAHADAGGVVRGVGSGELLRLGGLTQDRLKSQLAKFLELGFLRSRVPGVAGRHILGKAPGAFFLNPEHPDLGVPGMSQLVVLGTDRDLTEGNLGRVPDQLYLGAEHVRKMLAQSAQSAKRATALRDKAIAQTRAEDALRNAADFQLLWERNDMAGPSFDAAAPKAPVLHELLADKPSHLFADYLQLKIDEYAAFLLTEAGVRGELSHRLEEVASKAGREIPSSRNATDPTALVKAIVTASHYRAAQAQSLIKRVVDGGDFHPESLLNAAYVILPLPRNVSSSRRLAISIRFAEGQHRTRSRLWQILRARDLTSQGWQIREIKSYPDEPSVDEGTLLAFGLRSQGKRYPSAIDREP